MTATDRIDAQVGFLKETEHLKSVLRASRVTGSGPGTDRFENSAEHSWQVMLYALVLAEHAIRPVNIDRVLRMLLIHDIVEIDAGDFPIHGEVDHAAQAAAEQAAADRLFALLPTDQARTLRGLWDEFEAAATDDAIFAKAIDRLTAPISNLDQGGGTWADYGVTMDQMEARVGTPMRRGAPALWDWLFPRLIGFFGKG